MSKPVRLLVILITAMAFAASTVSIAVSADDKPPVKKPEKAPDKKDDKTKDNKAKDTTKKPPNPQPEVASRDIHVCG